MTMTKEKCAACPRHLASTNTNPDRLCGRCQGYLVKGQPRYAAWVEAGRPSISAMLKTHPIKRIQKRKRADRLADQLALKLAGEAKVEVASNHTSVGLPPVDRLPLEYLAKAVEEFRFRTGEAAKISALAKRLKVTP